MRKLTWGITSLLAVSLLIGCTQNEKVAENKEEVAATETRNSKEQREEERINKVSTVVIPKNIQNTIQFQQFNDVAGIHREKTETKEKDQASFKLSELDRFNLMQKSEELLTEELHLLEESYPAIQNIGYVENVTKFIYYPLDEKATVEAKGSNHLKYAVLYHIFNESKIDEIVFHEVVIAEGKEVKLRSTPAKEVFDLMLKETD